jgi:hypothetical protein
MFGELKKIDGFDSQYIIRLGAERMGACLSNWITDPVHLKTLVEVFECIMAAHRGKTHSMGSIHDFVKKATTVLNQESPSKVDLQELQNILQEISNMREYPNFPIRGFLGDHRRMIGESMRRWSSGKMLCFLRKVIHWNGLQNDVCAFSHDYTIYSRDVTSDAIRRNGATLGPDFRKQINDLWLEYGCSENSSLPAPLNMPRSALESPRTSVGGATPLNTPRSALESPRTSVGGATPLNTPRSALESPRTSVGRATPRSHLCTVPPHLLMNQSIVLEWFMGKGQKSFKNDMKVACSGMTFSHDDLVHLYDRVTYYHSQNFREGILENNPHTLAAFFERVSECRLIKIVLASSPYFRSLKHVAFADDELQSMFLEGLVFSFFNACRRPFHFQLGISKIVLNPDGENFSISLFPEKMRIAYLAQGIQAA